MNEVLTLIKRAAGSETTRDVFCGIRSIGQQEFYQSNASDFRPVMKFILADYLDYDSETLVRHNGQLYRVVRTYRTGQELELVVELAPAEDGEAYG